MINAPGYATVVLVQGVQKLKGCQITGVLLLASRHTISAPKESISLEGNDKRQQQNLVCWASGVCQSISNGDVSCLQKRAFGQGLQVRLRRKRNLLDFHHALLQAAHLVQNVNHVP